MLNFLEMAFEEVPGLGTISRLAVRQAAREASPLIAVGPSSCLRTDTRSQSSDKLVVGNDTKP